MKKSSQHNEYTISMASAVQQAKEAHNRTGVSYSVFEYNDDTELCVIESRRAVKLERDRSGRILTSAGAL